MKTIFKLVIYFIVFLLSLLILLPKQGAYNLLEKELAKKDVVISDEIRDEKLFTLNIIDSKLYYQGIEVANTSNVSISSFLIFSEIKIKDVKLLDSLKTMAPSPISNLSIEHSVLEYDKINIKGDGLFGELLGHIDLINRIVSIELIPSKTMKNSYSKLLRNFKLKDGRYMYEYKF